jgi:hypothetical protein
MPAAALHERVERRLSEYAERARAFGPLLPPERAASPKP